MFSDITIKINGEDIRAHKIVLAHASDFFKACLKGGFKVYLPSSGHILLANTLRRNQLAGSCGSMRTTPRQ